MSCECFKIGGKFIAEDPDCEVHGIYAQVRDNARELRVIEITRKYHTAKTVEELHSVVDDLLALVDDI